MLVDLQATSLQLALEAAGLWVALGDMGDHHRTHVQTVGAECIDQPQHIRLVRDAQIGAHLVACQV
ncbi:hypothetical protein SDC9_196483 [bioreactor metagenome]|uniref:Uncharacterized protein n=1 Tax=bioreactor metagenome TaxID=1076179 RepID=A0A645IBZ0_9ZZZZ